MNYERHLIDYLPQYYHSFRDVERHLLNVDYELSKLYYNLNDTLNQNVISTATWGLSSWEKLFGISNDSNLDYETRRAILISKLRGLETTTPKVIEELLNDIYPSSVPKVKEIFDEYRIEISFNGGNKGKPKGIEDVYKSLREIMPAHIAFMIIYSAFLIKDIHNELTINEMNQIKINEFGGNYSG